MGFEIHRAELPDLAVVVDTLKEALGLVLLADLEPVFDEDDSGIDDRVFNIGHIVEKGTHLLIGGEAHHTLDAGTVVPAPVQQGNLAAGRQMLYVALQVHLGFLALGWAGKGNDAEHARTGALGQALDDAAFAGRVASLERNTDIGVGVLGPFLQLNQLVLQLSHLFLEHLAAHQRGRLHDYRAVAVVLGAVKGRFLGAVKGRFFVMLALLVLPHDGSPLSSRFAPSHASRCACPVLPRGTRRHRRNRHAARLAGFPERIWHTRDSGALPMAMTTIACKQLYLTRCPVARRM